MNLWLAAILSMVPFTELRLTIPWAIATGANPIAALVACVIFNIIIIIPIFLFLDFLHGKLLKFPSYRRTSTFFLTRIRRRSEKVKRRIDRYGFIALALFVAIPLPITGAWTGSIVAWLLNLNRKKSFPSIALGVLIAGIIVTLITVSVMAAT